MKFSAPRTAYALVGGIYLFFLAWSGLELSPEVLPIIVVVVVFAFAALAPDDIAKSAGGIRTVFLLGAAGIVACLVDGYRLYRDPGYRFDGFSAGLFFVTLGMLALFLSRAVVIFRKREPEGRSD